MHEVPTCLPGDPQLLAIAEGTLASPTRVQSLLCAVVNHSKFKLGGRSSTENKCHSFNEYRK